MSKAPHLGDRVIVSLLQPLARGERFGKWPLHLTLVPWFRTHLSAHEVMQVMAEALRDVHPFTATMGQTDKFGFQDQVPVRLVNTPNGFQDVHMRLLKTLHDHPEITVLDAQHTGPNFRAHVTLHGYEPLREGDIIACNDLQIVSLVNIHPGGSIKEVEGEIDLGKTAA